MSWVVNSPGVICEPSLEIPQRFIAGLSQRWSPEYRVENIGINSSKLQSGIILYKRIHNSGQNNFLIDDFAFDMCHNSDLRVCIISYNNCNPGGPVGLPQGCKPIHWNPNTFLEKKVCWQIAQKLQKTSVANFTYLFWTLYFASRTKNKLKQLYFNGAVSMFFQQSLHLPKNKQPKWRLWSHDPWDHISWFPLPSLGPSPMENPMLKG